MIHKINSLTFVLFILLFSTSVSHGYSQEIAIKGKIINAENGRPVEFANVGVLLSAYGASSDSNGDFEFSVPADMKDYSIQITAVGYKPVNLSVSQFIAPKQRIIEMTPLAYDIDEVDVEAKSLRYYQILGQAVENISINYPGKAFNYSLIIERMNKKGANIQSDSIQARMYMPEGYNRNSFVNDHGYRIVNSTYKETYNGLMPKLSHLGDALKFDIVKTKGNILDTHALRKFDITFSMTENDSLYIVEYASHNPDVLFTGFSHCSYIKGKIYILKDNYAVVKNEMELKATKESLLGGEFNTDSKHGYQNVNYFVLTEYKPHRNKFILDAIEIKFSSDENTRTEKIKVTGFTNISPEIIKTRDILFTTRR